MALRIRLARGGTKKRPHYNIVITDSRNPRDGRFIEKIGFYNPLLPSDHADRIKLDLEKAKGWIAKGAVASDRVAELRVEADADPGRRIGPLGLEVLGRRDHGDALHDLGGEQLGGDAKGVGGLARPRGGDREEVLR